MVKIAVFDSGLGSLSIIKAIQKHTKCQIIYFADQKNYPYGKKSRSQLAEIIKNTIKTIRERFEPELIVMGSNTPTVLLGTRSTNVLGVSPPLKHAIKITKTKNIAILATQATVQSKALSDYIIKNKIPKSIKIHKINSSKLVDLVESGDFLNKNDKTKRIINQNLAKIFAENKIDTATLSSTHLPFLGKYLKKQFPNVTFIDPADDIAKKIAKKIKPISKNKLEIYSTGNIKIFQKNLKRLGIKNRVISF